EVCMRTVVLISLLSAGSAFGTERAPRIAHVTAPLVRGTDHSVRGVLVPIGSREGFVGRETISEMTALSGLRKREYLSRGVPVGANFVYAGARSVTRVGPQRRWGHTILTGSVNGSVNGQSGPTEPFQITMSNKDVRSYTPRTYDLGEVSGARLRLEMIGKEMSR